MLDVSELLIAEIFALVKTGNAIATRTVIMTMTVNSSTRLNARNRVVNDDCSLLPLGIDDEILSLVPFKPPLWLPIANTVESTP